MTPMQSRGREATTMKDKRYCLGAALLERENPDRVICRHLHTLLAPDMDCEQKGFFGNVVFTEDPLESVNLAGQYPDIVHRLLGDLENWFEDVEQERATIGDKW